MHVCWDTSCVRLFDAFPRRRQWRSWCRQQNQDAPVSKRNRLFWTAHAFSAASCPTSSKTRIGGVSFGPPSPGPDELEWVTCTLRKTEIRHPHCWNNECFFSELWLTQSSDSGCCLRAWEQGWPMCIRCLRVRELLQDRLGPAFRFCSIYVIVELFYYWSGNYKYVTFSCFVVGNQHETCMTPFSFLFWYYNTH